MAHSALDPTRSPSERSKERAVSAETGAGEICAGSVSSLRGSDDFARNVWGLLGLPVDLLSIDDAVSAVRAAIDERRSLSFITPNVSFLTRASADPAARREMINAELSLIDGAPLVAAARLLGLPVKGRTAGSDLFEALRRGHARRPIKVFFFGGREGAAHAAAEAINLENGHLQAVGAHNPGFGDLESCSSKEIIDAINAADPDFLVVALGAAKGQAWIERNRARLTAPVVAHLGAVVDFTAGSIARAPAWMQRVGLEWAWRIKEEPSLWRRYAGDAFRLLGIAAFRLAPLLVLQATAPSRGPGRIETERSGGAMIVKLSGDITIASREAQRAAFRLAARDGGDVILDLGRVGKMDGAFIGMAMMLEKALIKRGGKIYVEAANAAQLRYLRANALDVEVRASAEAPPKVRRAQKQA